MARLRPLALLVVPLLLAGCAQTAAPPDSAPSATAPTSAAPTAVATWTAASLWATCAQEWERQHPELSWSGFEEADEADFVAHPDGLHYLVRYRLDDSGAASEARDCAIGGTPQTPSVLITPPLDGLDPAAMPPASSEFAVRG